MTERWLLLVFFGSVTAIGCATTRSTAVRPGNDPGFPNHSAPEILNRLPGPDSLWSQLQAEASISYRIEGERGSVTARITFRQHDSLLVRLRGPAGVEPMRALFTADSVLIYDRLKKTLYTGEAGVETPMLPAFFGSMDRVTALLGFGVVDPNSEWDVEHDSLRYRLHSTDGRHELVVDPAWWRVVIHEVRDARGTVIETRRFTDFDRFDGLVVPRRIVVIQPESDVRASVYLRRLTQAPDDLSFNLNLKPDVRRVPLY